MAKILFLCCLVLLSWTLQQVFLEGLSPVRQRRQSRVPRQVRPSEYKRKEQARRLQGQRKPRKPITTFGDGLNQMHQASLKGNVPKAVEIFEELSANSEFVVETSTINTIIQAAANIGNVDSAEKWFKKIPEYGCNATVESYTGLISAYTKKRKVAKAEKVFKDMQVQEIEPDSVAYGALLSAFAGVGDLRSAEKYFSTMESARLKPNEIVYGAMVKAAGTSKGGYLEAERWLQRMEDANLKPGKIEYTELINCAGKARDLKAAEAVFVKMGAAHVMPDAITYTAMINAAAQTEGPECAASKFEEMLMLNLKPTVVTYNTLMRAWFQAQKYQEVLETFKQMKAAGKADGFAPNVVAYTAVIKSLYRLGRVQEIEPTLVEKLGGNVKADDYCRQALKDALGTEEYTRISKKLGLDRYGVATTADKIDSRIEQTQKAKLDNMRREQNKALLRNRPSL